MESRILKIAVIGFGLAAESIIIKFQQLAKENPNVYFEIDVVEKHDLNFSRAQKIIILDPPNGIRWDQFCEQAFYENKTIRIQGSQLLIDGTLHNPQTQREKLIYKFSQPEDDEFPKNCSIKQLQASLLEQIIDHALTNFKVNIHINTQVQSINFTDRTLTLTSSENITFNYLLICEGEQRKTLSLINKTLASENQPQFRFGMIGQEKTYHMAVKLRIKRPNNGNYQGHLHTERAHYRKNFDLQKRVREKLNRKVNVNNVARRICDLQFLYDPNLYKENLSYPNWVPKFFVAGPVPDEVLKINDEIERKNYLIDLASNLVAMKFNISPDTLELDTGKTNQHTHRAHTFAVTYKYVEDPVIVLSNGVVIAIAGDSAKTAVYQRGISSALTLVESIQLAESILKDEYECYRKLYKRNLEFITSVIGKQPSPPDPHLLYDGPKKDELELNFELNAEDASVNSDKSPLADSSGYSEIPGNVNKISSQSSIFLSSMSGPAAGPNDPLFENLIVIISALFSNLRSKTQIKYLENLWNADSFKIKTEISHILSVSESMFESLKEQKNHSSEVIISVLVLLDDLIFKFNYNLPANSNMSKQMNTMVEQAKIEIEKVKNTFQPFK